MYVWVYVYVFVRACFNPKVCISVCVRCASAGPWLHVPVHACMRACMPTWRAITTPLVRRRSAKRNISFSARIQRQTLICRAKKVAKFRRIAFIAFHRFSPRKPGVVFALCQRVMLCLCSGQHSLLSYLIFGITLRHSDQNGKHVFGAIA